jgi:hypothetical protein
MQTSNLNLSGPRTGNSFARKARALLAEIYYALELSNRAYYQGVTRF